MCDLGGIASLRTGLTKWNLEMSLHVGLRLVSSADRLVWVNRIATQMMSFRPLPFNRLHLVVGAEYRPHPNHMNMWLTVAVLTFDGGA